MNRIRILSNDQFKVVGIDNLYFEIGYYRTSDHRFHGVNVMLNVDSDDRLFGHYNNHLLELETKDFIEKFNIHNDDAEWLRKKIVKMNKIEDDRVEIDNVELSIISNAKEYSILIGYGINKTIKTEFYSILPVVFYWAAQKIADSKETLHDKWIMFNALEKFAIMHNCNLNADNIKENLEEQIV